MMTSVKVQAERLAGVGWQYSVPIDPGKQLMIIVEDRGPRHLMLTDPLLDAPLTTVRLSDTDANVVAALLTGTRFHIKISEDETFRRAPEETVARAC
jgi:K+/H+ antiporter YhaU regulatory subunit KhtT